MNILILIGIIPVWYWLMLETNWLRVNLNQPNREISLFDRTVNKLLAEFDGDFETWDWKLNLNYMWYKDARISRQHTATSKTAKIADRYPELNYNDLVQMELAYESLIPPEPEFEGELEPANLDFSKYGSASECRFNKRLYS